MTEPLFILPNLTNDQKWAWVFSAIYGEEHSGHLARWSTHEHGSTYYLCSCGENIYIDDIEARLNSLSTGCPPRSIRVEHFNPEQKRWISVLARNPAPVETTN